MKLYGIVLILVAITLVVLAANRGAAYFAAHKSDGDSTSRSIEEIPPFTDEVKSILASSPGFHTLVSYTDNGFEPTGVTLEKGQTIRFTNNSTEDLWVAATPDSGTHYPQGTLSICGQSALDSCGGIARGEFWEFTFNAAGSWSYQNNGNPTNAGVVLVK